MSKENKKVTKKSIKPGKSIVAPIIQEIKTQIISMIDQGAKDVTMDLSGVESFDSAGLCLLIAAQNSLKDAGGRLILKNMSEKISKFMQTTNLDSHFEISIQ